MDESALSTVRRLPGVRTAYLISASSFATPSGTDPDAIVARLLGALVGALGDATDAVGVGTLSEAMVEGSSGSVVVRALGGASGAVVVTEAKANLGLIRLELRKLPRVTA